MSTAQKNLTHLKRNTAALIYSIIDFERQTGNKLGTLYAIIMRRLTSLEQ